MRPVAVRDFRRDEVDELRRIARKSKVAEHLRWAGIVLARGLRRLKPRECAELFGCCTGTVANVVRRWNAEGLAIFRPPERLGRPRTFTEAERSTVVALAKEPPQAAGKPWNQWSLHKLVDAATGLSLVAKVSHETVRQWLKHAGVTPQRMKTWKDSNDPAYALKKRG